ncbi:MAG: putative selenate reductase subunit YgfK [Bacteroidales bacterium]
MLTDKFYPTPLPDLLQIILKQYEYRRNIFGIPENLFFRPKAGDPFRTKIYKRLLEAPLGVAAGPHTQLSQNIVTAWLTGARFIELKTIQTLDELEVSKPCIDMQDEGYNCEWSQELKVSQSFEQYLDAWILIHILKDKFRIGTPDEPGFIFNMSVGYDLKGILNDNVQWFFQKMQDASTELEVRINSLKTIYPRIKDLKISSCLSDNVTLSTMHGCPPDEIEQIGKYLLSEKRLHTNIKLNPTLLGKETLTKIVGSSGFETRVPDIAFEHDPEFADAVNIISELRKTAVIHDLHFGIKLTNTLESVNHKNVFPPEEKMMYMSGRALHPVSVAIAAKLQNEFKGELNISFCGGTDAFNFPDLIACGLSPVTVCTDLLKPGGYGRLHQYIEELENAFKEFPAPDTEEFIRARYGDRSLETTQASLINLNNYAAGVLKDDKYRKTDFTDPDVKTNRPLGWFDCIHAPCVDTCPTHQDIPNYNYYTAKGDFRKAAEVILQTNPFPRVTGKICDHLCQFKCTRINYDHPVLIREIKRFVAEKEADNSRTQSSEFRAAHKLRAAIIGAGPSGLSCACFLARAGFSVSVYENKPDPGGMVSSGIPSFRLDNEAIRNDIAEIEASGVKIYYNQSINKTRFEELRLDNDYIYIAAGAQLSATLNIEGNNAAGVLDPLQFLEAVKKSEAPLVSGKTVLVIGGGNTAMDVARTAYRLAGNDGKVIIIYRRTIREMPADKGEIRAVLDEGIEIMQLLAPVKINTHSGKVKSLVCRRMKLGDKDTDGRARPVEIPGSEFEIEAGIIIPAIGQQLDIDFCDTELLRTQKGSYETRIPNVFIGGDAMRGASTAINAIGDGRKAAQEIIDHAGIDFSTRTGNQREEAELNHIMTLRAKRIFPVQVNETPLNDRMNFKPVSNTITEEDARYEASRCLLCDEICNTCVTVCPNLAFFYYEIAPIEVQTEKLIRNANGWIKVADKTLNISQKYQILHIADWCNNCGNCNAFCPSHDAPYLNKPHLFLSEEAFTEEEEGFRAEKINGKWVLHQKSKNKITTLTKENGNLIFFFGNNHIVLDAKELHILNFDTNTSEIDTIETEHIIKMSIILQGAISLLEPVSV